MFAISQNLPAHSRIWIYQSSRELTPEEEESIGDETRLFLENWTAHNQALQAGYEIRYQRFLILMIDEKVAGASGCSIDKSVHFIQALEKKTGLKLLDRMLFAFKLNGRVEAVSRDQFEKLFADGTLNHDTIVFNNLVQTKNELDSAWEIPVRDSWHRQLINS